MLGTKDSWRNSFLTSIPLRTNKLLMLKGDCGEASLREKIISLATPGEANPLCLLCGLIIQP